MWGSDAHAGLRAATRARMPMSMEKNIASDALILLVFNLLLFVIVAVLQVYVVQAIGRCVYLDRTENLWYSLFR